MKSNHVASMDIIKIARNDNAQVNLDYIAGMGIFLLAIFFVFQYVNSLFIPFQSDSDKATLAADRTSAVLVERLLHTNKSDSNIIDQGRLYSFNDTKLNYSNITAYTATLSEIGLFSNQTHYDLNVSVAFTNGSTIRNGTSPLVAGPPLPNNMVISQTNRVVLILNSSTGQPAILSVKVW